MMRGRVVAYVFIVLLITALGLLWSVTRSTSTVAQDPLPATTQPVNRNEVLLLSEPPTLDGYLAGRIAENGYEARINLDRWQSLGVRSARTMNELADILAKPNIGDTVYVDANAFRQLDRSWVQHAYRQGVAFVVIGAPLSELMAKVGASDQARVPDLDLQFARGRLQVAMCQEYRDANGGFGGCYTDFARDLNNLPVMLRQMVKTTPNEGVEREIPVGK